VVAHVELDMQRKPSKAAPPLELPKLDDIPLFNLFGGGQKALQPKEKDKTKKPAAEELPPPLPPVRAMPGRRGGSSNGY